MGEIIDEHIMSSANWPIWKVLSINRRKREWEEIVGLAGSRPPLCVFQRRLQESAEARSVIWRQNAKNCNLGKIIRATANVS